MSDWRPIETAPKDGRVVLGYDTGRVENGCMELMRWDGADWIDPATDVMRPTHWMPLPEPPSPPSREEE